MKDKLLYDAFAAHATTGETKIEKQLIDYWNAIKVVDAKGLQDPSQLSDTTAKCVIACVIASGGAYLPTICTAGDRVALQAIAGRALDNYRKLRAKSAVNVKVRQEIYATHSNYGEI